MPRFLVLPVVLLAGVAACADVQPTTGEAAVPTACVSVSADRCDQVVSGLEGRLGDMRQVAHLTVLGEPCDEPCVDDIDHWRVTTAVEYVDGRPPVAMGLEVDGRTEAWETIPLFWVSVQPRSGALLAAELRLELGHCGLNSGIDVDGSFWDPVGPIDGSHPTMLNATAGTFRRVAPSTAVLHLDGGPIVQLVRHEGVKHLPGCD